MAELNTLRGETIGKQAELIEELKEKLGKSETERKALEKKLDEAEWAIEHLKAKDLVSRFGDCVT